MCLLYPPLAVFANKPALRIKLVALAVFEMCYLVKRDDGVIALNPLVSHGYDHALDVFALCCELRLDLRAASFTGFLGRQFHHAVNVKRGLRLVLPLFLVGAVAGTAMYVASALGRIAEEAAGTAYLVYVGAAGPLTLVAFWDGWRRSSGVLRQRFTWLLGALRCFSCSAIRPGSIGS